MGTFASGDTSTIVADCAVILADTSYTSVYRAQDAIFFRSIGHRMWPEGSFIPTLIPIDVPPRQLPAHSTGQRPRCRTQGYLSPSSTR